MSEQLKSLQQLGDEFERVARKRRKPVRVPRRTLLFAVIGTLSVTGGAIAASQFLVGYPVKDPAGYAKPTPNTLFGVVRSSTVTKLRVPDPDGGPAWGMRTMNTSRAFGCVQVGRIVDGKLGLLGQDGAFANDGKFHETAPTVLSNGRACQQLDGAGKLYIAISVQGIPASGQLGGCTLSNSPGRPTVGPVRPGSTVAPCKDRNMRILYYGTVGPDAKSITYVDQGVRKTVATSGPLGAYLIVKRPEPSRSLRGSFVPSPSPMTGLRLVTYRDGTTCRIQNARRVGGARRCPRVGFVRVPAQNPTAGELATTVRAEIAPKPVFPPGVPRAYRTESNKQRVVTVSFKAPISVGPRTFYYVLTKMGRPACGPRQGWMTSGPITRNVRAGEVVREVQYLPISCHGVLSGSVRFQDVSSKAQMPFQMQNYFGGPLVGKFSVQLPKG